MSQKLGGKGANDNLVSELKNTQVLQSIEILYARIDIEEKMSAQYRKVAILIIVIIII
jgi:hypothetical protein